MEKYTVKFGARYAAVRMDDRHFYVRNVTPEFLRRMVRKVAFRGYPMRENVWGAATVTVFDGQMRYVELVVRSNGRIYKSITNTGNMPWPWVSTH